MQHVHTNKSKKTRKNQKSDFGEAEQVEPTHNLRRPTEPYWAFGDLRYYESCHELETAGKIVRLRPKVHALLRLFLESNGKTLEIECLIGRVWGVSADKYTAEDLHKLKSELNRKLGDKTYIESIPKVGYRLTEKAT